MFNKVLIPIVYNHNYSELLKTARFFYSNNMDWLYIFHVLESGFKSMPQVEAWINELARRLYLEVGVKVSAGLSQGHVASKILAKAREFEADLVFIPVIKKNVVHRTLLGSTSSDVVRLTDKPTFVHKNKPDLVGEKPVKKLLFATDFSEGAQKAGEYIKNFSCVDNADLVLVHVGRRAGDPISEHRRRGIVNNKLGELVEEYSPYFNSIKTISDIGSPSKTILKNARELEVDLIVIGKYTKIRGTGLTGSTAENVITKAEASVLLV